MLAKAKKELGMLDETGEYKPDIKGKFRKSAGLSSSSENEFAFNFRRTAERKSNRHLIVLILLLVGVLYFCTKL